VDVVFRSQVVSPDLVFISKDRLSIVTETNIQGAPDLAVEVLSPSTQKYDRKQKSQLYHATFSVYRHSVGFPLEKAETPTYIISGCLGNKIKT
jgi:hypothetical protein